MFPFFPRRAEANPMIYAYEDTHSYTRFMVVFYRVCLCNFALGMMMQS